MTTQANTTCAGQTRWSDAEHPLNCLEAVLWMVFEHVGEHVHKDTGNLMALHVFQCLHLAIDQVDAIQKVFRDMDLQFAQEVSARKALQAVK